MPNYNNRSELLKDAPQAYRQLQSTRGEFMPSWEELSADDREKWVEAVKPVIEIERQRVLDAGMKAFEKMMTDYGDVVEALKNA